jgi:aryl carrier-like protein
VHDATLELASLIELVAPLVPDVEIRPDTPLLSTGLLDSFGLVELAARLADRGIDVELDQLGADNADTCEQLLVALGA